MYLYYCSELDSVFFSVCSKTYICFFRFLGRINSVIVVGIVIILTFRAVIKLALVVVVGL